MDVDLRYELGLVLDDVRISGLQLELRLRERELGRATMGLWKLREG